MAEGLKTADDAIDTGADGRIACAKKKRITPANGPTGVSPTKGGGLSPRKAIRESLPRKEIGESSLSKTVECEMSVSAKDDSEKREDARASAQDREGGKDDGLSQGEDEVDKTEEECKVHNSIAVYAEMVSLLYSL